jgi:hypothetical protein
VTGFLSLGIGLGFLFLALSVAMPFLAVPMRLLKGIGALKIARWFVRAVWRSVVLIFQLVANTRRLDIRRPDSRQISRRAR